ncbi:hypothetical protein [Roseibium marinum]|uniref:Uncharacterized protein n=1 Tax=Roseibium marinum TaxID=281252 RepID=A0A2S3UJB3_9HYPH|nr:hypothetical protein [Roseibium marinum]POF27786.1 hypothetical protein CLV41_12112 [Roseibium marinum]POF27798.1 hypothetical protein CLV41_12124 [Roseibium marinum]
MAISKIAFFLHGTVNGESFDMNGKGVGDRSRGTCELHLEASPSFPVGFDPVSCPLICSHPTSTFFAKSDATCVDLAHIAAGAFDISPAREGVLRDSSGEELLRLSVTSTTRLEDDCLVIHNEMTGVSRLPRLKRNVTPLRDYIMPAGPGRATALIRYQLETEAGALLDGVTTVPYAWAGMNNLPEPLVRNVHDITVNWDGRTKVSAFYNVSIAALEEKSLPFSDRQVVKEAADVEA